MIPDETATRGYDADRYLALAGCGIVSPDDRTELLDGLIVSMAPASPLHDAVVHHVQEVLSRRLPAGTLVRTQTTFVAGPKSVPEPDVAVLPGRNADYLRRYPSTAHLLVEVADSSLAQDRLTKAAIYARAAVPTFWIVNLRDATVECFEEPDAAGAGFRRAARFRGPEPLPLAAFPDARIEACELFPTESSS